MRRLGLGAILVIFTVLTVLLSLAAVGSVGARLLRRLVDQQAIERARLAATAATQAIDRDSGRLLTAARLLADRPTLAHLLQARDRSGLEEFVEKFCATSRVSGCLVAQHGAVVVSTGTPFRPEALDPTAKISGGEFLMEEVSSGTLLLGGWYRAAGAPDSVVFVVLALDDGYARRTGEKVGMEVAIVSRGGMARARVDERLRLRSAALEREETMASRQDPSGLYLAIAPLRSQAGEVLGVVEAALGTATVDATLRALLGNLLLLSLAVAAAATLFSLLLARRVTQPLRKLTEVSGRIGRGDLASAVPRVAGLETGELAGAMEEMRERISVLTGELRRRRAEAEAILAGITEGVFVVDRERRIRYMNPQSAALLQIDAGNAIGRFCGEVLKPAAVSGAPPCEDSCPILHARFRGGARATEHLVLPAGGRRTVVITSAPPAGASEASDEETQQFQVIRDETEVETGRRLRDAIFANISHEFRTPLSAQLASLELLRDPPELAAEEVAELVRSIERGTLRLTRLIDNLLESTRIEAGELSMRRQPVALDAVVEEAMELMAPLIEQRKQSLEVDLPYPMPSIQGDSTRLVQVLVNLLANANKFAPPRTRIGVGGRITRKEVRLFVEDEGPGLPDGAADTVFHRYTRSPGEEPAPRGMGLGLWIVKSIVQRHSGRVEAESRERGTRMWIILPREELDEDLGSG